MPDSAWAAITGAGVYLALRLIDYLLPRGHHWRFVDRYTNHDHDDDKEEEET